MECFGVELLFETLQAGHFMQILPEMSDPIFAGNIIAGVFGASFILAGKFIYGITDRLTLVKIGKIGDKAINLLRVLVSESKQDLAKKKPERLTYIETNFGKELNRLLMMPPQIAKCIVDKLMIDESRLDNDMTKIHFLNGYWDLVENRFRQRVKAHDHLVTKCIKYEFDESVLDPPVYTPPPLIKMQFDREIKTFAELFSSPEAFNFFQHCIRCSLMNEPLNNFFVFLGSGSNGKSALFSALRSVFSTYVVSLESETLDKGKHSSKILANIAPNTVFTLIDETEEKKKKSSSLLKNMSTGNIDYSLLYNTDTVQLKTRSKLIINSNHPLSFTDDDAAIRNRILYFKFPHVFSPFAVDIGKTVKGVVVKQANPRVAAELTDFQKTCIFLSFAFNARERYKETPPIPSDILTRDKLVDFKTFVTKHFKPREDAFVSKAFLMRKLIEDYPDFPMGTSAVVSGLKGLVDPWHITYEKNKRCGGRGVFVGIYSEQEPDNVTVVIQRDLKLEQEMIDELNNCTGIAPRHRTIPMETDNVHESHLAGYSSDENAAQSKSNGKRKPVASKHSSKKQKDNQGKASRHAQPESDKESSSDLSSASGDISDVSDDDDISDSMSKLGFTPVIKKK